MRLSIFAALAALVMFAGFMPSAEARPTRAELLGGVQTALRSAARIQVAPRLSATTMPTIVAPIASGPIARCRARRSAFVASSAPIVRIAFAARRRTRTHRAHAQSVSPRIAAAASRQRRRTSARLVRLVDAHAAWRRSGAEPRLELEQMGPCKRSAGRRRRRMAPSRWRDRRPFIERPVARSLRQRRRCRAYARPLGLRRGVPRRLIWSDSGRIEPEETASLVGRSLLLLRADQARRLLPLIPAGERCVRRASRG